MVPVRSILKLIFSVGLGAVIGFEREKIEKPAGLRTHMLVCLGSTLATILALNAFTGFKGIDPTRIMEAVLVGMGFLGAGTILKMEEKVVGLTTAASLWVSSSIGIAIGSNFYFLAVTATILAYLILKMGRVEKKLP